jgi:haloalkane dehalogenase
MWDYVAQRLGDRFTCFAVDLPGFGHSEIPRDYERSLDGLARFVETFRIAARIESPVNLVAHDFGGIFACAWAVRNPAAVKSAVVINAVFFSDYEWHRLARIWRTPILGEIWMALIDRRLFARIGHRAFGWPVDRRPSMHSRMKQEILRLYRAIHVKAFADWEERLLALTAKMPTMVIWGDRDPYIPQRYAERFGAVKVVHLSVGHSPALEAPEATAQMVREFFGN